MSLPGFAAGPGMAQNAHGAADSFQEIQMNDNDTNGDRRNFMRVAATTGLIGAAVGVTAAKAAAPAAPARVVEDPKAPPGLKATPDMRYPLCFQTPVTEGVRVLMDYFTALNRRDAKGMADAMHFPFASLEGVDNVVVKTPEDLIRSAPASMNLTENPERFTDHDGYMKAGSYDVFDGIEVFHSDPISVDLALSYWRYGPDGKRLLKCEGIYQATNNDGRWALQRSSTIFTPLNLVGIEYPDAKMAAQRLRIDHDLQFSTRKELPHSVPAYPSWRPAPADAPRGHSQTWLRMHSGESVMTLFKVKGIKSRVNPNANENDDDLSKPGRVTDYEEYRDTFKPLGQGPYGMVSGIAPESRVVHHTADKVHYTACAARYNATGEELNWNVTLCTAVYKLGYWRGGPSMSYVMYHDRGNDRA
jgi:hypothetical protein